MDDRICGTCRHFEWATQAGRGWCRNPRLYTASQSQPVSEFELACATRQGDFWEASDDFIERPSDAGAESEPPVDRSLEYDEHEVLSGGSQMRGSSADQPRSSDDAAYTQGDVTAPRSSRVPGGERSPQSGGSGDRPPSYQTEERYWTDYLRIALPIAGLLLLLSVFWFWASSFIGGDDNGTQTPVVAINTPITQPTATLADVTVLDTPTTGPAEQPTQPPAQPTQPPAQPTEPPAQPTQPAEQPTQGTSGEFAEGDLVIVNDNDVNMRAEATTSSDIVDTLSQGTELTILSGTPQQYTDDEGNTYTFWNVRDAAADVEGWVAGDFLQK